jgi:hypothetical protein
LSVPLTESVFFHVSFQQVVEILVQVFGRKFSQKFRPGRPVDLDDTVDNLLMLYSLPAWFHVHVSNQFIGSPSKFLQLSSATLSGRRRTTQQLYARLRTVAAPSCSRDFDRPDDTSNKNPMEVAT